MSHQVVLPITDGISTSARGNRSSTPSSTAAAASASCSRRSASRGGGPDETPATLLDLLDWKRRIFALYAQVRGRARPGGGRRRWAPGRDELFRAHPQSPRPPAARAAFTGLDLFDYDPALRVTADVVPPVSASRAMGAAATSRSRSAASPKTRFGLDGAEHTLELYWLDGYGGGLFLPFRDATAGAETYGGGRYLLDTVKGADLGTTGGRLVLDFNFAYNPSCCYDPGWVCPLSPPANRLAVAIRAGERHTTTPP